MIRLLLAAEDQAGSWTARHVADLCMNSVAWVADAGIDHCRQWVPFGGREWLPLKDVSVLFEQRRRGAFFAPRGRFGGESAAPDALAFRKLFLVVMGSDVPTVLIVARDEDEADRRTGFEQARRERSWPFAIVGALAKPEAEAWLICAVSPDSGIQGDRLARLRQDIGFDPLPNSHRLTSTSASPRDAKRVLQVIESCGVDAASAFRGRSTEDLRVRGEHNGLRAYLDDLSQSLRPHLGG